MFLLHFVLSLICINYVTTTKHIKDFKEPNQVLEIEHIYSFYPPAHNAIRKRQAGQASTVLSEGGGAVEVRANPVMNTPLPTPLDIEDKVLINKDKAVSAKNQTVSSIATQQPVLKVTANSTVADEKPTPIALDLNNPGVVKRGVIVFGGFLLLAVAYYVFCRRNDKKTESGNPGTNDTNQFRYGVLHSDDRRDNLELSQIPLTMESDDDDDEDLEIFDLGQKKKSLSYINLQTNDEDLVFNSSSREIDTDNLLLDIEDSNGSETLINWSNDNKSTT